MPIDKQKVSAAAQKYIQKGAYDKAIRELNKLVEVDPDDVRTLLKIGNLYSRKGDTEHAVEVYLRVAQHYKSGGFYQKAVAVFKQIVQLRPDRIDVAEALGTLYCAQGLVKDALTQYRSVLERYLNANNMAGVGRSLGVMVQIDPDNHGLRVTYAEHLAKQRQLDAAIHQFSIVLNQLQRAQKLSEYAQAAERLLFYQSDNLKVLKDLAGVYLQSNLGRRALGKLQSLYKLNPQDTETLELLVHAFNALGQASKAVDVLKELARVYQVVDPQGHLSEQTWRRAASLAPHDADVQAALSAYDEVPMLDDSALEVVEIEPVGDDDLRQTSPALGDPISEGNAEVLRLVEECDACLGYNLLEKAYANIQAALAIDPHNRKAHERLAEIYRRHGQDNYAAQVLRELATSVWGTDRDGAKAYLVQALDLDGESEGNLNVLTSLGLTPAQLRDPVPQVGMDLDLELDLGLDAADLLAPAGSQANPQRQVYATLPPDAFELLPEEGEEEPTQITGPVNAGPPPLPNHDQGFELSGLDAVLNLDADDAEEDAAIQLDDDDIEGLFNIDDDDIDSLFGGDLLTGEFSVPDSDVLEAKAEDGYFGSSTGQHVNISEGDLEVLLEDLAEADFYTAQGLYNEAGAMIDDLRQRYGEHPLITAARIRLDEHTAGV